MEKTAVAYMQELEGTWNRPDRFEQQTT